MYRRSSRGKEQVIDLTSSPVSKRTRHSPDDFNRKIFKTLLDFQTFFSIFKNAPTVVERNMRFETLGSTLSLRFLQIKIGQACSETLRILLMNWLRSFT